MRFTEFIQYASTSASDDYGYTAWQLLLWIVALGLAIAGIANLFKGAFVVGGVLIIAAFLVGPGGVSLFS